MLGTNPLSFAAPSKKDPFVLDMSTSTAAIGKVRNQENLLVTPTTSVKKTLYGAMFVVHTHQVEVQARKELPIPGGLGVDSDGNVSVLLSTCYYQLAV